MKLDLDKVKVVKARCEGRGYFLRAPREPWDWDVDTIRVECLGCPDCKPKKQSDVLLRKNWRKYRVRECRYLNFCELCKRDIKAGEQYFDGGYSRRAHVECVKSAEFLAAHPMVEFPE